MLKNSQKRMLKNFPKTRKTSSRATCGGVFETPGLVIRWAYQHQILAGEVKNSAKVNYAVSIVPMFFWLTKYLTATFLKRDGAFGVFALVI